MKSDLYLLQLVDSAYPTGAFSHSFGMEAAFQEKKIKGANDLYDWMVTFLTGSLVPTEGNAVYMTHRWISTLKKGESKEAILKNIHTLDRKLYLSKIPKESREGSMKIGKRYLKMVQTLYPESGLQDYQQLIKENKCFGNSAIVHGWIASHLDIDESTAIFTYLYTCVNNQLQSALRLTAVGQTDVQRILQQLYPLMKESTDEIIQASPTVDDIYNYSVTQEIESMRHETLYSRLFMS